MLFNLTQPRAAQDLHALRGVLQGDSDIEALDEDHFVLVIKPVILWRLVA